MTMVPSTRPFILGVSLLKINVSKYLSFSLLLGVSTKEIMGNGELPGQREPHKNVGGLPAMEWASIPSMLE